MKTNRMKLAGSIILCLFVLPGFLFAGSDKELWNKISKLKQAKQYQQAIEIITNAIENNNPPLEKKWLGYRNRGLMHFYLERYDEALIDVNKALELKPGSNSYLLLSLVYESKREYKNALEAADLAVQHAKSGKNNQKYEKNLQRLKSTYFTLYIEQARNMYRPAKINKYLFVPPVDDSGLKGKMMEWEGYHDQILSGYHVAYYPHGHREYRWAFVNPNKVDLTTVKQGWIRVIGEYKGKAPFRTLAGQTTAIPVLSIRHIENTRPSKHPLSDFQQGVQ